MKRYINQVAFSAEEIFEKYKLAKNVIATSSAISGFGRVPSLHGLPPNGGTGLFDEAARPEAEGRVPLEL